jgi:hypothetical protein
MQMQPDPTPGTITDHAFIDPSDEKEKVPPYTLRYAASAVILT